MENQNNFTVGTTFWKWFFSGAKLLAMIFLIGVPICCIIWREQAITGFGSLFFGVIFPVLILGGAIIAWVNDWKKEKSKLK